MAEVQCAFCLSKTNKVEKAEAVRIDGKNFHSACAQQYLDRKELFATICRIFNLKAPGPRNNAFIKRFREDGMTYSGMTGTLIYFYDIKGNSIEKANEGIGIIPWTYEEAKKYFEMEKKREQESKERLEQVEKIMEKEKEVRYVRAQKRVAPQPKLHPESEFLEW